MNIVLLGKSRCYFEDVIEYIKRNYDSTESVNISSDRVNLIFGLHEVCKLFLPYLPKNIIIFNTEQLYDDSEWLTDNYKLMLSNYNVLDYSTSNQRWMKEKLNKESELFKFDLPYQIYSSDKSVRDIDVLFYGTYTERRWKIKEQIKGCNVVFRDYLWGDEKTNLINRAKVILNIHRYDACIFEIVRVFPLLNTNRLIISERCKDEDDYKDIKDVIFTDDVVDTVNYLVSIDYFTS